MRKKIVFLFVMFFLLSNILNPFYLSAASYDVSVDVNIKYQTLEGFGAAIAWYNDWVTEHPQKKELYEVLFFDSGLDILRIRNQYRNTPHFAFEDVEIIECAKQMNPDLKIFLSSWSPPEDIKRDGVMNGGTLIQENGSFVYDKFADYWYESLLAYREKGIVPDYISIQNEPDYENQDWETCIFRASEEHNFPGYDKALDTVYDRLQSLPEMPKILAPEVTGVGSNLVQNYLRNLDMDKVYGIAHHLYNGGDGNNPDSFNSAFRDLASSYKDKPLFQTEYDYGTPFDTAHLIHNSLVIEGVSSYFYWDLIWDDSQRPLVELDSPFEQDSWLNDKGYNFRDFYYSFQHYAKYTKPGYQRVEADSGSDSIKVSAFISPDDENLTVVLINTGHSENTANLNISGFSSEESAVFRTDYNGNRRFEHIGSLSGNTVTMPARSAATVAFGDIEQGEVPELPSIPPVPAARSAFDVIEAEQYNSMSGIQTQLIDDKGNRNVSYIENGNYVCYENINFNDQATGFKARVSSDLDGGNIEIRLNDPYSSPAATISVANTGGWDEWKGISADIEPITGIHDLYLYFSGSGEYLFNIDNFQFAGSPAGNGETDAVGDLNGDGVVNSSDYITMRRYLLNDISELPVDNEQYTADLNRDNSINSLDYVILRQYILNQIDKLPYIS